MAFPRCFPGMVWMIAASAIPCLAQTTTTGLVEGFVRDASGRPLEGVQVRLVSNQITRTAFTNTEGRFHVGLLNPGEWAVTVAKAGFDIQTSHVSVAPEETVSLRFRMALVASATVEVTGSSTTLSLDPTSTSAGTTILADEIARLPVGRNMNDLAYLAPTVGFAGANYYSQTKGMEYSISGSSGNENQFITDGLITTDLRFGGQGLSLVPEFVESVQVETSGFKPEINALGGVFNTVLRSGANDFRGDIWAIWSPSSLEARAKSNAAGYRQPAPADRYDLGFGAGGALVKDRLFYFVGLDLDRKTQRPYANNSGLQGDAKGTDGTQTVLKVNGFLTPEQQLTATWITTRKKESQPRAYPDGYGDADKSYDRTFDTSNLSLVYDHAFSSGLLLSMKAGTSRVEDDERPKDLTQVNIEDGYWFSGGGGGVQPELATLSYFRGGYGTYVHEKADTTQFKADLTWIMGSHALKAGISHMDSTYWRQELTTGPAGENLFWTISQDGTQIISGWFGNTEGARVKARYQALYVQDTWEVAKRFRLIYGLRTESQEQWDNAGRSRISFTDLGSYLQPRLGFTWDTTGDGRALLTGSYAVYYEQMPQRLVIRAWGTEHFDNTFYELTTYSPTGLGTFDRNHPIGGFSFAPDTLQVAPGARLPRRQEFSMGFEKTLPRGMTLSLHGLFRHLTDPLDDSILLDRDGNAAMYTAGGQMIGLLWNPSPNVTFMAPAGAVDKDGHDIGGRTITVGDTLFPKAYNKYGAVTLGVGRQSERSFWNASYTWSHLWGNFEGMATPDRGTGTGEDANFGPSFDGWPYVGTGNLGLDRRHNFKLFGSHRFVFASFALNLGGRWIWQSGLALSLQDDGSTTMSLPPGTLGAGNPLDPLGFGALTYDHGLVGNHGRSPSVSVADLHLDLEFKAGKIRLLPSLDVYNVFNTRTATAISQYATKWWTGEPDNRYGEAKEWLQGRRIQVGLKARF